MMIYQLGSLTSRRSLLPSVYSIIPPADLSTKEHMNWVEAAVTDLLDRLKYLHDWKDELGKTKNFTHPGLHKAIILFIYTGSYCISHRQLDIFCKQVTLKCLALVTTAVSIFQCLYTTTSALTLF
jgi:hypothetical protein